MFIYFNIKTNKAYISLQFDCHLLLESGLIHCNPVPKLIYCLVFSLIISKYVGTTEKENLLRQVFVSFHTVEVICDKVALMLPKLKAFLQPKRNKCELTPKGKEKCRELINRNLNENSKILTT